MKEYKKGFEGSDYSKEYSEQLNKVGVESPIRGERRRREEYEDD